MRETGNRTDSVQVDRRPTGVQMNKILICDDDPEFVLCLVSEIRAALEQLGRYAQIHTYQNAEDIPKAMLSECDIAFLDIDFANKTYSGIDIARQLRKVQQNAVIIFVTNFPEYAPEGYEVQAFRYLLKSGIDRKLLPYLAQTFEQLATTKRTFQLTVAGEPVNFPLDDILYVEAQLHTVVLHLQKAGEKETTTYSVYSSLANLEEQLMPLGFLRIHKSYLVNMRHLRKYQCKEAVLSNGMTLKVSEKNYSEQKKKFLLWKGKQ